MGVQMKCTHWVGEGGGGGGGGGPGRGGEFS